METSAAQGRLKLVARVLDTSLRNSAPRPLHQPDARSRNNSAFSPHQAATEELQVDPGVCECECVSVSVGVKAPAKEILLP